MTATWAKNMAGFKVGEGEMKTIPYPRLELTTHVTTKTVELFGTAGTLLIGPLVAGARKQTRNFPGVVKASTKFGRRGVMLGLLVGPLMTWGRMRKMEGEEAFYDRCFRIRNNCNQVRVDRSAYAGALTGAIVSPLIFKSCPIFGGLLGMSLGTVGAGIFNNAK